MPKRRFYRRKKYSQDEPVILFISLIIIGSSLVVVPFQQSFIRYVFVVTFFLTVGLLTSIFLVQRNKKRALKSANFVQIDAMTGVEFEEYIQYILQTQGFTNVSLTRAENDFGVDVLAEKDDERYAFQVKRYKSFVGVDAIYQVVGGAKYYNCQRTVVITNSYFTPQAKELAEKTETVLVDREELGKWIGNVNII